MFSKIIVYQMFMLGLALLVGCAGEAISPSDKTNKASPDLSNSTPPINSGKFISSPQKSSPEYHYFAFNHQKFRATKAVIKPGVEVFDLQLNSYANVTNKVVAVLQDSSKFREKTIRQALVTNSNFVTTANVDFRFVTDGVVEIIFTNNQIDILAMYNTISAMDNVKQAELLLHYQPQRRQADY